MLDKSGRTVRLSCRTVNLPFGCATDLNMRRFLDSIKVYSVKLCMIKVHFQLDPFMPLSVNVVLLEGHSECLCAHIQIPPLAVLMNMTVL